jgi:galactose mutarotase-like enzyme
VTQLSLQSATGDLHAAVNPRGAQLWSLRVNGGPELAWTGNPASWPERALTLFPLIGPAPPGSSLPDHGFARLRRFTVVEHTPDRLLLGLDDDADSRAAYAFRFSLRISFALERGALRETIAVENPGDEPMPVDVGFHPGFAWPLESTRAKGEYSVVFDASEDAPIRRGEGDPIALRPETYPTPVDGRTLRLRDALFDDAAIVWDQVTSRGLTYGAPSGRGLRIEFPDSPHLALWMIPGSRFLAIEPWQGLPRPVDFAGALDDKPGITWLLPGERRTWRLHVIPLQEVEW